MKTILKAGAILLIVLAGLGFAGCGNPFDDIEDFFGDLFGEEDDSGGYLTINNLPSGITESNMGVNIIDKTISTGDDTRVDLFPYVIGIGPYHDVSSSTLRVYNGSYSPDSGSFKWVEEPFNRNGRYAILLLLLGSYRYMNNVPFDNGSATVDLAGFHVLDPPPPED
jgi:hypothetical protein